MVVAQHENRRAAMFVDEDCDDSRSDVDDLRTCDCVYDKSSQVRYKGWMDGWLGFNGILSTQVAAISCLRKFKVC